MCQDLFFFLLTLTPIFSNQRDDNFFFKNRYIFAVKKKNKVMELELASVIIIWFCWLICQLIEPSLFCKMSQNGE